MAIPVPKLHKATGQAYVYYQGKTRYLGKYGTKEADEKYWAWRATLGKKVAESYLIAELVERYGKENQLSANEGRHTKLLKEEMGAFLRSACDDFGPLAYREVRKALVAKGGRCARYVNSVMQTLQRMFRWGVSVQVVTISTYEALKTVPPLKNSEVKQQGKPRVAVPRHIVEATLPFMHQHVQHMVQLQLATGARPSEILSIRVEHIDKDGPNGTWVYKPDQHKTSYRGKVRHLVFGSASQEIIRKQMELFPCPDGWLFPTLDRSEREGHYMPQSYHKAIRVAAKAAGLPHWSPYQLRHLRITEITRDHGLETAAAMAGHGGLQVTQGYSHEPTADQIRQAS
jgi:integrase